MTNLTTLAVVALSKMTPGQVQDYIDLLVGKHDILGEHYVARQLAWAVAELERVGGAA